MQPTVLLSGKPACMQVNRCKEGKLLMVFSILLQASQVQAVAILLDVYMPMIRPEGQSCGTYHLTASPTVQLYSMESSILELFTTHKHREEVSTRSEQETVRKSGDIAPLVAFRHL